MRRSIIDMFQLPRDVILDLPRLTMVGREQLMIENHRGIVSFHSERVVIGCRESQIWVTGRDLEITSIDEEEVILAGHLEHVTFSGDRG